MLLAPSLLSKSMKAVSSTKELSKLMVWLFRDIIINNRWNISL